MTPALLGLVVAVVVLVAALIVAALLTEVRNLEPFSQETLDAIDGNAELSALLGDSITHLMDRHDRQR